MSMVYPLVDGFVGYGDGLDVLLRSDEPMESTHPCVVERPELFRAAPDEVDVAADAWVAANPDPAGEPTRRGPGRPPGSRNRPKDG